MMSVFYDLEKLDPPLTDPVLTIGNFDGVHQGHLTLFNKVKERAKAISGQSVVITFEPHPIKVMSPGNGPPLITPTLQKLKLINATGIDVILCLPFTKEFASMSPEAFVKDLLVDRIGIKEIVVGYDYSFGYKRTGNIDLLKRMGKKYGFLVHVIEQIFVDSLPVSSTNIRNFVREGRLAEAKVLLGRDYEVCGKVVRGKNRGTRLLGIPTANLELIDELTPKPGVYVVRVMIDDKCFSGVTNIGYNPTFGNNAFSVETHLLNFSGDLVGKTIRVCFIQRLRDERTFRSIEELSEQIHQDIRVAEEVLRKEG